MVNTLELKAQITRKGLSQQDVYEKLGFTKQKWYTRMRSKKFNSDEMYQLTQLLDIEDPKPIFFADEVTQ